MAAPTKRTRRSTASRAPLPVLPQPAPPAVPVPAAAPAERTLQMPSPDDAARLAGSWQAHVQALAAALAEEGRHPLPLMIGAVLAVGNLVDRVQGNPAAGDALLENLVRDLRQAVLNSRALPPTGAA